MWLIKAQESVLNLKIKPALPKTRRMTESTLTQCLALLIRSWSQADSWTLGSYRAVNSCFLLKPVCVGFCQPASKGAPSILQLFSQNPARRPPTNGKEHERGSHPRQVGRPSLGGGSQARRQDSRQGTGSEGSAFSLGDTESAERGGPGHGQRVKSKSRRRQLTVTAIPRHKEVNTDKQLSHEDHREPASFLHSRGCWVTGR